MLHAENKSEQCSVPKNCLKGRRGSLLGVCEWDCAAMTLTHEEICVKPTGSFYVSTAVALVVVQ